MIMDVSASGFIYLELERRAIAAEGNSVLQLYITLSVLIVYLICHIAYLNCAGQQTYCTCMLINTMLLDYSHTHTHTYKIFAYILKLSKKTNWYCLFQPKVHTWNFYEYLP